RMQRPLWASTSTKDKAYSDVKYVDALIGADTITTVPPETLARFEDHGAVTRTLPGDPGAAAHVMQALVKSGIDFADVTRTLEAEGIEKFAKSYETLLETLKRKRQTLAAA
ncbi:MAG: transaldolase family protein, partial [Gemmatimonadaceae bacterium]